ncbi:hypothetical protein ACFVW8_20915 [Streptomyces sp. NPDC058221]|uniref:hypothetical protein n=1 Tax=Streptomyces sp. NPDC058221 TaxID=3346388 RepID=UPI0036E8774A
MELAQQSEDVGLDGFERVPEVEGITDTWWRNEDSLVAVCRGEAVGFAAPHCQQTHVYGGLEKWSLGSE